LPIRAFAAAAILVATFSTVQGADLSGAGWSTQCIFASQSQLASLPEAQIEVRVSEFYSDAEAALETAAVLQSRSPAFLWARETRFQCGKALGYLEGGHVVDDVIAKCDCAHGRLLSYR
jgi:hypothetical protein